MITKITKGGMFDRSGKCRRFRLISLLALTLGGCVAEPSRAPDAEENHPANPKATVSKYSPPANVLKPSAPDSAPSSAPRGDAKETSRALPEVKEPSAELRTLLEELLKAYEEIRLALAADKADSISKPAKALSGAANQAAGKAPDGWKDTLTKIATDGKGLDQVPPLKIEAARKTFGELSRQVIRIVSSVPALGKGRRVFHCPMWNKGYAKWIQVEGAISNPYLGKEMPECGSPSEWKE